MQLSILRGLLLAGVLWLTVLPTMAQQTYPDYLEVDRNLKHYGIESRALWAREEVRLRPDFRLVDATYNETRIGIDPTIVDETDEDYTSTDYEGLQLTPQQWQYNPTEANFPGFIDCSVNASNYGSPEVRVNIDVFPGIHGIQPEITLQSNPSAGSAQSIVGQGMSLSGMSVISKRPKSQYYEGTSGIELESDDYLSLDGQILVLVGEESGNKQYRVPHNNKIRITGYTEGGEDIVRLQVKYASGVTDYYNQRDVHVPSGNTYQWYRTKTVDKLGNYINYEYMQDPVGKGWYLERILYNATENLVEPESEVLYQYNVMEPYVSNYLLGEERGSRYKLNKLIIKNKGKGIGTYEFEYFREGGTEKIFLKELRKTTATGKEYPPIQFQWNLAGEHTVEKIPNSELPGFSSTTPYTYNIYPAGGGDGFYKIVGAPLYNAAEGAEDQSYFVLGTDNINPLEELSRATTTGVFSETTQWQVTDIWGSIHTRTSTYGQFGNFIDIDEDNLLDLFYFTSKYGEGKRIFMKHAEMQADGELDLLHGHGEYLEQFWVNNNNQLVPLSPFDLDQNGKSDMIYFYKSFPEGQQLADLHIIVLYDDLSMEWYDIGSEVVQLFDSDRYLWDTDNFNVTFSFFVDTDQDGDIEFVLYSETENNIIHLEYDRAADEFVGLSSDLSSATYADDFNLTTPGDVNALDIERADVNGDGNTDFLVYNGPNFFVLISEGNGQFHIDHSYSEIDEYLVGSLPNRDASCETATRQSRISRSIFYPGDYNGDGFTDIGVLRYSKTVASFVEMKIFFVGPNGIYESTEAFSYGGQRPNQYGCCDGLSLLMERLNITVADLNSDNRSDILVQGVFKEGECRRGDFVKDESRVFTDVYISSPKKIQDGDDFALPGSLHKVNTNKMVYEFKYGTPNQYNETYENDGTVAALSQGPGEDVGDEDIDYGNPYGTLPYGYELYNTSRYFQSRVDKSVVLSEIKSYTYLNNNPVLQTTSFYKFTSPKVHKKLGFLGYAGVHKWTSLHGEDDTYNFSFEVSESRTYVNTSRKMVTLMPSVSKKGFGANLFDYHDGIATTKYQDEIEYRFQDRGSWYNSMPTFYQKNSVVHLEDGTKNYGFELQLFDNGNLVSKDIRYNGTQELYEYSNYFEPDYWDRPIFAGKEEYYIGCIRSAGVTGCGSDQEESTVETTTTYDNLGRITQLVENSNLDAPLQRTTNFTGWDDFGNNTAYDVTVNEQTKYYSKTFNNTGKYVVSETNPAGMESSYEYDLYFGNITKTTTPTGLQITRHYNRDGILVGKTDTRGNYRAAETFWISNPTDPVMQALQADYTILYKKQVHAPGVSDIEEYSDKFGNVLVTVTTDPYTLQKKYVRTFYDQYGRKLGTCYPTYTPADLTDASNWKEKIMSFDYMERPLEMRFKNRDGEVISMATEDYAYEESNKLTATTVTKANGKTKTVWKDYPGNTVAVTDNSGTVNYSISKRQLPKSMGVSEESTIHISYDPLGRKNQLDDPNFGIVTYISDADGKLLEQIKPNSHRVMQYDVLDRVEREEDLLEDGEVYTFSYYEDGPQLGLLAEEEKVGIDKNELQYNAYGDNTHLTRTLENRSFEYTREYDYKGRTVLENYPSGVSLQYSYNATTGKLDAVTYNGTTIWEPVSANKYGQLTQVNRANGLIEDRVSYDALGAPQQMLTKVGSSEVSKWRYQLDNTTGNLMEREDLLRRHTHYKETFQYDDQDRLWQVFNNTDAENPSLVMGYNGEGNITSKSDVAQGNYTYTPSNKPHAVKSIKNVNAGLGYQTHAMVFNSLDQPTQVSNSNGTYNLTYGISKQRVKMTATDGATFNEAGMAVTEKLYVGAEEWLYTENNQTFVNHYVVVKGQLVAIIQRNISSATQSIYYPVTDHLGSITMLLDENGAIVNERSYDAWGRPRNPADWTQYNNLSFAVTNRGYTGHEHLLDLNLVNMNGRMYDPIIGRMLSPDNYVQNSGSAANYNRYTYVLNNPLKYRDPDGEIIVPMLIGASIGVVTNGINNLTNKDPFFKGVGKAALFGGVSGAFSFGIGQVAMSMGVGKVGFQMFAHGYLGGLMTSINAGSFKQGFISGALGSLGGTGTGSLLNATNAGRTAKALGVIGSGALLGGTGAEIVGGNFWDGARNGAISAGLNHGIHDGYFGANLMASSITGRFRHLLHPDAVLRWFEFGASAGMSIDLKPELELLRGDFAGYSEELSGVNKNVGDPGGGVSYNKMNLYYDGAADEIEIETFTGSFNQVNVGVSTILGVGLSFGMGTYNGNDVIGIGQFAGVSLSMIPIIDVTYSRSMTGEKREPYFDMIFER